MSTEQTIHIHRDPPLAWLTLNRPEKHNALNRAMWERIPEALNELESDETIRVIVFRGAGDRAFSAGADIKEFSENLVAAGASAVKSGATDGALTAIEECAKPTLGMVHGRCYGGGCAIALALDLRVCSTDATFAITPAKLGLGYPFALVQRAVNELGPAATRQLLMTAQTIDAERARAIGLVQEVVEPADLKAKVEELARTIARNAPLTIHAARESIREAAKVRDTRGQGRAEKLIQFCFESHDYREGIQAFLEKRPPRFEGR